MRKKGKTLFMLALCCTLLGSNSMVYASSKGVSEDQTKATATSTKVEKPDFLSSFEEVENSDDYIGTTQEMADTGEAVAMFNSKYTYLIIGQDGDKYYSITEGGEKTYSSAKDVKNANFIEVSSDYGFTSKVFSYEDSFSVLVKDGNKIKYVGTFKSTADLNKLDDYLDYSKDTKVKLTLKDKTGKSATIHVEYELDKTFIENDPYGSELRSISLFENDSHIETRLPSDEDAFDFTVDSNGTYKVVVNTFAGSGEATIKVTNIDEVYPEMEDPLTKDTKAPKITFSEFPKSAIKGDEVEITMYSDEPAILYFNGKVSKKLVTEMKVTVKSNNSYGYRATDKAYNTSDGKLKISFFKDESDDEEIVSDDNRDSYWDEVNKNNGYNSNSSSSSSSSSDETELPQTGGISLVSSLLGGVAVIGAGVLLALKETSKRKKVVNESNNETENVTYDSSNNSDISTDGTVNEDVDSDKTEDSNEEVTEDVNKEEDNQIQE